MPLFGPNINKMRETGDVQGLKQLLKNNNSTIRLEAVRSLGAINGVEALSQALANDNLGVRLEAAEIMKNIGGEALTLLCKHLVSELKLGKTEHQMEALIKMQGRVPHGSFVMSFFSPDAWSIFEKIRFSGKLPLDLLLNAFGGVDDPAGVLMRSLGKESELIVGWFGFVTLAELGARNRPVPRMLVYYAEEYLTWSGETGAGASLAGAPAESSVRRETVRALSYFVDDDFALESIIKVSRRNLLSSGYQKPKLNPRYAICALGALGRPEAKQHLEFFATRGEEDERAAARIALELFGRASFDEIAATASA
jgi:hypothetical protein